jgi:hypothetical protein
MMTRNEGRETMSTSFAVAELELIGARQRLRLAERQLENFRREHANKSVSPELAQALAREEDSLLCELDSALRRHRESLAQVEELQVSELPRKGASEP